MYDKLLGSNEFIEFIETEYNLKKKIKSNYSSYFNKIYFIYLY